MGVAEAVALSVNSIPEALRGRMLKNIVLVGGNTRFPGFKRRLEEELRSLVETKYDIDVRLPSDPLTHVWHSAAAMIAAHEENQDFVTREEYNEHGASLCRKRFFKFK
uniref:Actin-related protein 5 n=1 Tax=Steinernema glaseri TaxID=37863 RepID=A0A1I8AR98_9BILA